MTTMTYRGCTIFETGTTTDVARGATARVWGVSGRREKPAMQRPLLTSAAACRRWIREQDDVAEALREEAR